MCKRAFLIQELLSAAFEQWGLQVERVELRDVTLPPGLERSLAAEAEAVRVARAKVHTHTHTLSLSRLCIPLCAVSFLPISLFVSSRV